ncbi:MAG: hypothetical protein ACYTF7_09040 [Planctomycetota bacterium]
MGHSRATSRPRARRLLILGGATAICAMQVGCRTSLFDQRRDRSQYQAYDEIRNQHEPQVIFDAYGRPKPNLRGRLSPKQ